MEGQELSNRPSISYGIALVQAHIFLDEHTIPRLRQQTTCIAYLLAPPMVHQASQATISLVKQAAYSRELLENL